MRLPLGNTDVLEEGDLYQCGACRNWFAWSRCVISCDVNHPQGECCHEYEKKVSPVVSDKRELGTVLGLVMQPSFPEKEWAYCADCGLWNGKHEQDCAVGKHLMEIALQMERN